MAAVNVPVHRCLDIRMTRNRLNGFHIRIRRSQQSEVGVAQHMWRRTVQIDGFADPLPGAVEFAFGDGLLASADDVSHLSV